MNNIAFTSYNSLTTHKSHCKYYYKNPHFIDEDLEVQKDKVAWSRSHSWSVKKLNSVLCEIEKGSLSLKGCRNYLSGKPDFMSLAGLFQRPGDLHHCTHLSVL